MSAPMLSLRALGPLSEADPNVVPPQAAAKPEVPKKRAGIDDYEKDSEAKEEVDLLSLLIPGGVFPPLQYDKFGVVYSQAALKGWVKQPSPCCCGASIAGARNALMNMPRDHEDALTSQHAVDVLIGIMDERIEKKKASVERQLEGDLAPLEDALVARLLAVDGKELGGKKEAEAKKKVTLAAVKAVVADAQGTELAEAPIIAALHSIMASEAVDDDEEEGAAGEGEEGGDDDDAAEGEGEVLVSHRGGFPPAASFVVDGGPTPRGARGAKGKKSGPPPLSSAKPRPPPSDSSVDSELQIEPACPAASSTSGGSGSAPGADDDSAAAVEVATATTATTTATTATTALPAAVSMTIVDAYPWRRELWDYFNQVAGRNKLKRDLPNTAFCGNWAIKQGMTRLSGDESTPSNVAFTAKTICGAKLAGEKLEVPLSRKDSSADVSRQWAVLKEIFMRPDTVLVFHTTNHYALIFAAREWVEHDSATGEATSVRQLLTAKRGQRPQFWMDWSEARNIMLGWTGYRMMAVEKKTSGD